MSTAAALATQKRAPEQQYYVDPFEMTRQLIKDEFQPALPHGVSKAWTVAAYTSADAYRQEITLGAPDRRRLAAIISYRFLTPARPDPNHELLKQAVDLATTESFRRKRRSFYEWQENIFEEQIADTKALEELEQLLNECNKVTKSAFKDVVERFAFAVIPITLGMAGAIVGGEQTGLLFAGAGGLVELARFWRFDRNPTIDLGDLDAAAMIHDARRKLPLI